MVACDSYNLVASDHKNFDGIQQQNVTLLAYAESNPVSLRRQPGGLYLRARQTHMCAHVYVSVFVSFFSMSGGNRRDLFYLNFKSSYLMNGLTD